ncbi:hypothetical protein AMAG_07073 [Allomyces macrogynus ATCC 38327]|uniref:Uncharacterized protein n=1 Tax=Allomyces macrogynus (strain ATCC 38327) TaxID=578462 RepID=A0A0L0SH66_ALLM3|nr:hypothetical protein AMAG_07073 [Allomyces macrogynus ATCC 38327]|eukprot:KNE61792.1 hypothetical protein AMAG_07073 [Allomyces macrogynus ATCC 38327]
MATSALASSLQAQDERSTDALVTERARRIALAWTHEARALDRAEAVRVANHRSLLRASRPTSTPFPSVTDLDLAATLSRGLQAPTPGLARAISYSDTRFHATEPPAPAVYSVERPPATRTDSNAATNAVLAAQEAAWRVQEQQKRAEQLAQRAQERGRDALLRVHMTRERDRLTADLAEAMARDRERRRDAASVYHGVRNAIHAEMPPQAELNRMFAESFPGAVPVAAGKVAARGGATRSRVGSGGQGRAENGSGKKKRAAGRVPVAAHGPQQIHVRRGGLDAAPVGPRTAGLATESVAETRAAALHPGASAARQKSRGGDEPRVELKDTASVGPTAVEGESEPITSRTGVMPTWHTHTLDEMLDELGSLLSASALALDATAASLLESSSSCSQLTVPVAATAEAPLEQK